ncbi:MAG: HEAT repeat domain-containing protein [Bacteriovoracia bacterium]
MARPILFASLFAAGFLLVGSFTVHAKSLTERLLDVNAPEYNEALNEMENLTPKAKRTLVANLTRIVKSERPDEQRANAVSALGDIAREVPEAIPVLFEAVRDKYAPIRQAAVAGLGRSDPTVDGVIYALTRATRDRNKTVRAAAASNLGRHGAAAKTALPALKKLLADEDEAIREIAKTAIGQVGG